MEDFLRSRNDRFKILKKQFRGKIRLRDEEETLKEDNNETNEKDDENWKQAWAFQHIFRLVPMASAFFSWHLYRVAPLPGYKHSKREPWRFNYISRNINFSCRFFVVRPSEGGYQSHDKLPFRLFIIWFARYDVYSLGKLRTSRRLPDNMPILGRYSSFKEILNLCQSFYSFLSKACLLFDRASRLPLISPKKPRLPSRKPQISVIIMSPGENAKGWLRFSAIVSGWDILHFHGTSCFHLSSFKTHNFAKINFYPHHKPRWKC